SINGIAGRRKITTGQTLLVPVKAGAVPNLPDLPAAPVAKIKNVRYVPPSRRGTIRKTAHKTVQKKPASAAKAAAVKTKSANNVPAKRVKTTIPSKPASTRKINLAVGQQDAKR
ncbi:MAG: hypothetical protein AABZ67_11615, partial [Pseudomonadota bacterium]